MNSYILRLILSAVVPVLALGLPQATALAETAGNAPVTAVSVTPDTLAKTMKIAELIAVMREEGLDYGRSLEDEMFPGRGGPDWQATIGLVYDQTTMLERFMATFKAEIAGEPAAMAAIQTFFADERGQRILSLEIEARRALMDDKIEEAAKASAQEMMAKNDPRMAALRDFSEANDLIESNVQGALNANLGFYQGMARAGAFGEDMTEDQMLSDVWRQEPDIRSETEDWLYPFLALAYGPLSDDDLQAYTAFSRTPAGQRMNAALFAAFDTVFVQISRDLGRAAALKVIGDDI